MTKIKCTSCGRSFDNAWGLEGHYYLPGCDSHYEEIRKRLEEKGILNDERLLIDYCRTNDLGESDRLIEYEKLIAGFEEFQKRVQQALAEGEVKSENRAYC